MTAPLSHRLRWALPVGALLAYAVWTVLAASGVFAPLDRALAPPLLDQGSVMFQVWAAIGIVLAPVVWYTGLVLVAVTAFRHRLREVAAANLVAVALSWAGITVSKAVLQMPRPPYAPHVLGVGGWGYPSGHTGAIVTMATMVTATMLASRRSHSTTLGWRIGGTLLVLLVAADRWGLGAHWVSDIVGGALWGATASAWALLVCRVHVHAAPRPARRPVVSDATADTRPRAAVVYNPTKVTALATFVRHIEYELALRGWQEALWLPTTPEDPGEEMTAIAVREGVDLVIGAGGDGTVRVIAAGLAQTGIPLGIVPAGTGNLLARNVGLPLDELHALEVIFDGVDHAIDLVRVRVDDRHTDYFCALAGIGIDAAVVGGTDQDLKRAIGSGAYFVSAARHVDHPPLDARITLDDGPVLRTRAHLVVLGNVGMLQGGIQLLPDARPDDGRLDLVIASPRKPREWFGLIARVLTRRDRTDDRLTRFSARRVEIIVDPPDRYELDGDPQGTCTHLVAETVPGALVLRVPRHRFTSSSGSFPGSR